MKLSLSFPTHSNGQCLIEQKEDNSLTWNYGHCKLDIQQQDSLKIYHASNTIYIVVKSIEHSPRETQNFLHCQEVSSIRPNSRVHEGVY